jgi:histidinol dehydrogenase
MAGNDLDKILIKYDQPDFKNRLEKISREIERAAWFLLDDKEKRLTKVIDIIREIQNRGDEAVSEFTAKFDGVKLTAKEFQVSGAELKRAHDEIDKNLLKSLRRAIKNVQKYQEEIFIGNKRENQHPGIQYTPIESVGICVPGASAPLPSTVIMTAVPAKTAGVPRLVVVSPPRYRNSIHPVILAVCYELGIEEVYRIGGAHAVAALSCGTSTILPVEKIVGPGNQWVQTAKREVFGVVGVDSIAGPSEVLIIANDKANPALVAADMLSQAEHAPGSSLLFTDSQVLAENVLEELEKQVKQLNRGKETIECLKKYGGIAVFKTMDDVVYEANDFAPEHLQVQCGKQSRRITEKIKNAGAIFIGDYSPVAIGDYWAGPSHTLPTGGSAKFFSALSANDFIKSTSIIEYDKKKLAESAEDIIRLAEAEGLDAHARSIKIRQQK